MKTLFVKTLSLRRPIYSHFYPLLNPEPFFRSLGLEALATSFDGRGDMASQSAVEQIKFQRRFNAQQSSRLRGMERSFAKMVTRAKNPHWWDEGRSS